MNSAAVSWPGQGGVRVYLVLSNVLLQVSGCCPPEKRNVLPKATLILPLHECRYEKAAIARWFVTGRAASPLTNLPLSSLILTPNHAARAAIKALQAAETGSRGL